MKTNEKIYINIETPYFSPYFKNCPHIYYFTTTLVEESTPYPFSACPHCLTEVLNKNGIDLKKENLQFILDNVDNIKHIIHSKLDPHFENIKIEFSITNFCNLDNFLPELYFVIRVYCYRKDNFVVNKVYYIPLSRIEDNIKQLENFVYVNNEDIAEELKGYTSCLSFENGMMIYSSLASGGRCLCGL